ncbi:MAG: response regulator transcription factor [Acidimicrobiales bacterium]
MERPPIRVMIVDDQPAVRRGLHDILETADDMVVCGEASAVADVRAVAERTRPDVAVIDLRLADGTGVDASRLIQSGHPGTQVLVLTSASEDEARLASRMAGASGHLAKQVRSGEIVAAIRAVAEGRWWPPT